MAALEEPPTCTLAVTDPERARRDFAALTRYYRRTWIGRKLYEAVPQRARAGIYRYCRDRLAEQFKRYGCYLHPLVSLTHRGIPGLPKGNNTPNLKPHPEEERRAARDDEIIRAIGAAMPGLDAAWAVEEMKRRG